MQDIHIPVKWIAFWRCWRQDLRGSGSGGGGALQKWQNGFRFTSLQFIVKSAQLAGTNALTHG